MDATHFHLALNHVPVLGTLFGLVLLAVGLARKERLLVRVSLVVFVVAGLAAGMAYVTGERAEELVEHMAGVSEEYVESHEDAGYYALISAVVLGLFALGSLLFFRERLPRPLAAAIVVLAVAVSGIMIWTANLGGQIRHPEIRSGTVVQEAESAADQGPHEENDQDDDD